MHTAFIANLQMNMMLLGKGISTGYQFYLLLSYLSFISIVIPLTTGFKRRRYFTPAIYFLLYVILTSAVADAINFTLHLYHLNNLFVSRAYTLVEFTLLSLFFIKALSTAQIKITIRIIIFLFLIIAAGDLYFNGYENVDNISSSAASILLMVYALLGLYSLAAEPQRANIFSIPHFWFYTGILLFNACGLFLFIFSNYIQHHYPNRSHELFGINSINNIAYYILISIGFWKTKQV